MFVFILCLSTMVCVLTFLPFCHCFALCLKWFHISISEAGCRGSWAAADSYHSLQQHPSTSLASYNRKKRVDFFNVISGKKADILFLSWVQIKLLGALLWVMVFRWMDKSPSVVSVEEHSSLDCRKDKIMSSEIQECKNGRLKFIIAGLVALKLQ